MEQNSPTAAPAESAPSAQDLQRNSRQLQSVVLNGLLSAPKMAGPLEAGLEIKALAARMTAATTALQAQIKQRG